MRDLAPSCRLHAILARGSRRGIIFRYGPSKTVRLIGWDLETDRFEPGQWIRRTSVYAERADISPDGRYLLIFVGTFRPPFRTFTVLSHPPYFTALALWPKGGTWGGGGIFVGPSEIVLNHPNAQSKLAPGFEWPRDFSVHSMDAEGRLRLQTYAHEESKWVARHDAGATRTFTMAGRADAHLVMRQGDERYLLEAPAGTTPIPSKWADLDVNGDVLFSVKGALYRLAWQDCARACSQGDVMAHARCLADFSDMRFEPVAAPYASGAITNEDELTLGEKPAAFAPRLDRVSKDDRRRRIRARKAERALREQNGS